MNRFAGLLAGEVCSIAIEEVVVRAPHQRRPGIVAHPQENAAPVVAAAFEYGAEAVIIHPLGKVAELLGGGRLAETGDYRLVELVHVLRILDGKIMHSPHIVLGPEFVGGDETQQGLVVRHIGDTALGMHPVLPPEIEVLGRRMPEVGAFPAH